MKFKVNSESLSKALDCARKIIPAKPTVPALEDYLFRTSGNRLIITTSDMCITYECMLDLEEYNDAGAACIPANTIDGLIKNLPSLSLEFETDPDGANMNLRWETGQASFPVFPSTDFPAISMPTEENIMEIGQKKLVSGLKHVAFAMLDDISRPILSATYFDIKPDSLTLAASDAHKLVFYEYDVTSKVEKGVGLIVPKKCVQYLKGVLDGDSPVGIAHNENSVVFSFGTQKICSSLMKGKYPNYRSVIPASSDKKVTVDRKVLSDAVKRIATCANKANRLVNFKVEAGGLGIKACDLGYSTSASENIITASIEGNDIEIGFKENDLVETAGAFDSPSITILMSTPQKAALIRPANDDNKDGEKEPFTALLMPYMTK